MSSGVSGGGSGAGAANPTARIEQVLVHEIIEMARRTITLFLHSPEQLDQIENLNEVLDQLADYIERDIEARSKVTSALIYPAVVFVMAIATVVILATFVLPRFKTFFESFHATLPLPTRMLLSVSNFFSTWWWALLSISVVLVVVFLSPQSRLPQSDRRVDSPAIRPEAPG